MTESPAYQGSQWTPRDQQPAERLQGQDEEPQAEDAAAEYAQHESAQPAQSKQNHSVGVSSNQQPEATQAELAQPEGSQQPSQGFVGRFSAMFVAHSHDHRPITAMLCTHVPKLSGSLPQASPAAHTSLYTMLMSMQTDCFAKLS